MIKILIIFVFCVLFKFQYNFLRYKRTIKLKAKYISWAKDESSVPDMTTYQHEISVLFQKAKVKDIRIPISQRIGLNQIATSTISILNSILTRHGSVMPHIPDMFDSAIGYYRCEFRNAFNLLFWIETIVFLPNTVIKYIGIDSEKLNAKILNVILTAAWWIGCLFVSCFKSEIINIIKSFLEKLS